MCISSPRRNVLVQGNLTPYPPRSTPPSPPPKRAASSKGLNGVARPSTEAGWTWPIRRSDQAVPKPPHPRKSRPSRKKWPAGSPTETSTTPWPIGNSQPIMLASNSKGCTLSSNDRKLAGLPSRLETHGQAGLPKPLPSFGPSNPTNSGANTALMRLQVTRGPGNENIRFQVCVGLLEMLIFQKISRNSVSYWKKSFSIAYNNPVNNGILSVLAVRNRA